MIQDATSVRRLRSTAWLLRQVLCSLRELVIRARIPTLTIMENFNFTAMKRIVFTLTALAALLTSCVKIEGEQTLVESTSTLAVEAIGDDSRTYVDGTAIRWAETGESLNIIYFADDSTTRRQSATDQNYTVTDNRAQFTADFTKTEGATKYTFGAFYPYAYKSTTSSISLYVATEQNSTAESFDPATDILVSANPVVTDALPNKISFTFARMVAFAKMTIKGIGAGEQIQSVVFSSPAKPAGAVTVKVHEPNTVENAVWYNNYEDITIKANNRVATGTDTFWFTAVPTDLSGSEFTVTVLTDKNKYVKTVDLTGKTLVFERADVAVFTVKDIVKTEKPKAYKLLTDVAELNAGDKVVITNKKTESTTVRVMMNTMYDSSKIKLSSDYATINSNIELEADKLPEGTAVFTVENGATAGTFAFKAEGVGYLNGEYDAVNWSAFLNYSPTLEAGASWTVELISNGAKMSSCYDGTNTRYLNNYDNYKMNYANSRGTSNHYYIFYLDGAASEPETPETPETPEVTPLATPVVTATAAANTVTVAWEAVSGAADYTVTCGTATATTTATTAVFENLEYATEYTVTVVANPANNAVNSASEAATAKVTTEAAPAASEGLVVSLTLPVEGAVVDATANTFYEGDILISSTGGWRIQSEGSAWTGLYLGSGKTLKVAVADSSKHEITKVEMTAEAGGTLNFRDFTAGNTLVWEPGYGASSKTFTADSATRVATITVYYRAK